MHIYKLHICNVVRLYVSTSRRNVRRVSKGVEVGVEAVSLIRKPRCSHIECGTAEFLRQLLSDVERISPCQCSFQRSEKKWLRRIVTWYLIMLSWRY